MIKEFVVGAIARATELHPDRVLTRPPVLNDTNRRKDTFSKATRTRSFAEHRRLSIFNCSWAIMGHAFLDHLYEMSSRASFDLVVCQTGLTNHEISTPSRLCRAC